MLMMHDGNAEAERAEEEKGVCCCGVCVSCERVSVREGGAVRCGERGCWLVGWRIKISLSEGRPPVWAGGR